MRGKRPTGPSNSGGENYVTITGLPELLKKLNDPDYISTPAARFLDRWRFTVQRKAVKNFKRGPGGWMRTGTTRRSITSDRDKSAFPLWARVGSNQPTARWGEFGTGLVGDDPEGKRKRHYPPSWALEEWVRLTKPKDKEGNLMTAYQVARIIGRRGGLRPRRHLRNATDETEKLLPRMFKRLGKEIEEEASKGVN